MHQGKYLAGGLQSGCTANSTGVQYKRHLRLPSFQPYSGQAQPSGQCPERLSSILIDINPNPALDDFHNLVQGLLSQVIGFRLFVDNGNHFICLAEGYRFCRGN